MGGAGEKPRVYDHILFDESGVLPLGYENRCFFSGEVLVKATHSFSEEEVRESVEEAAKALVQKLKNKYKKGKKGKVSSCFASWWRPLHSGWQIMIPVSSFPTCPCPVLFRGVSPACFMSRHAEDLLWPSCRFLLRCASDFHLDCRGSGARF